MTRAERKLVDWMLAIRRSDPRYLGTATIKIIDTVVRERLRAAQEDAEFQSWNPCLQPVRDECVEL